jgi:hypothetical protein
MQCESRQHNYKQQLARPAYSMHDTTKSGRYEEDIGLGARRVSGEWAHFCIGLCPGNQPNRILVIVGRPDQRETKHERKRGPIKICSATSQFCEEKREQVSFSRITKAKSSTRQSMAAQGYSLQISGAMNL